MSAAAVSAEQLSTLARLRGVQLSYTGPRGRRVRASRESLLAIITALGHPVSDAADVARELAVVLDEKRGRMLDPVVVLQPDGTLSGVVRMPATARWTAGSIALELESGDVIDKRLGDVAEVHGRTDDYTELTISLGSAPGAGIVPVGYHQVSISAAGRQATALLLAPPCMPQPSTREFGVFAPLYALRGQDDWGIGTYTDLGDLADWIGANGGTLTGTLPLFAGFTDAPLDPSPYLPVSRRFWNDLHIDVAGLPEFGASTTARDVAGAADLRPDVNGDLVDYDSVARRKHAVLTACADELMSRSSSRRGEFESFIAAHPELGAYANFRAADKQLGMRWQQWDSAPGMLPSVPLDPALVRLHQYAQFVANEQLASAATRRAGLYLDLPVGVHPSGFDTWSQPTLFAEAGVGAPPDAMFTTGQSWGFPPLHPERLRESGYRYLIDSYRQVLGYARAIRIDHALGLQRMFWIPSGGDARTGAYVHNQRDEIFAVIAIEAARAGTVVIGEDLGVVPPSITSAMDRAGMLHTWVWRFNANAQDPFPSPKRPSVASLGSHDLPRFATYWRGEDIVERRAAGELTAAEAVTEAADRDSLQAVVEVPGEPRHSDPAVRAGLERCVDAIASGNASYLMIDLADLELETVPDNRPGTGPEAGNWCHRLRRPLADITADDSATTLLAGVAVRRGAAVRKEQVA